LLGHLVLDRVEHGDDVDAGRRESLMLHVGEGLP
jgi:hypothetical protein